MGICWYCYWGWPKPVADIYLRALDRLDGWESPLHYGPGHVVWADENFDAAESCLEDFGRVYDNSKSAITVSFNKVDLDIVRESLEELAKLPLAVRCPEPKDYDDVHPENYPPADGVEMVKL